MKLLLRPVIAIAALFALATTAFGQIETLHFLTLLVDPWLNGSHWAETSDRIENVESADHLKAPGKTGSFRWDSFGKIKRIIYFNPKIPYSAVNFKVP